jgi:CorA-like Mg2+ transporter protein
MNVEVTASDTMVRHFRQILLWPLQLMPIQENAQIQKHWEVLESAGPDNPWRELSSEFTGDQSAFQRRHYNEFVTFLPHVQRFLYGEGLARGKGGWHAESPVRVFRRRDIAKAKATYRRDRQPVTFEVGHVELYFFYDIDVVLLAVELFADNLSLDDVQHTLYRFGRAYPLDWDADGTGSHCVDKIEWLSADGQVLSSSDYEIEEKYLAFTSRYRSPYIASHWEFVLKPLALHYSGEPGLIRYRQLEFHRMPLMAYIALDDPHVLTRADFIRMGLAAAPGEHDVLPYSQRYLVRFERRYCYDRHWSSEGEGMDTRFVCSGRILIAVGSARDAMFVDQQTGMLGQFRHQYFLLFLIAHFHRAALLMLSDRLVIALNKLDIHNEDSVRQFKRLIRQTFEIFLRFTHRYWFHDVSDQAQARELFYMCAENLGTEDLYNEVREEIEDMSSYLDSDTLRRQSNSMVRLTVSTIFGMIATVITGFLGMNLIAEADATWSLKIFYFMIVGIPSVMLACYVILKSKRLSDFLDALSDERLSLRSKTVAAENIFRRRTKSVR